MVSKRETKVLDKRHIVHSWSVQDELDPIVVEKSGGVYFWDADGNRYLDFSSALVNMNIGYQHAKVVEAIKAQAEKQCYIHPGIACSARAELARDLAELTPGDLNRFFFTLAGADANENAIKIARAYTGKFKILARYRSYHGATFGAITLSGDPRRIPAEPGIPGVIHFFDPYCYHCSFSLTYPDCELRCAEYVNEILQHESPRSVAAMIVETQTGSTGWFQPPDGYFKRLREICEENDVLLIVDEVMTGFGRTGKWFAIEHYDVVPDIMTMAKGLTCGYVPLGAVAISDRIMEKLNKEMLHIGLTYNGHPLACATAKAVLSVYKEENLIENAAKMGTLVRDRLEDCREKHPSVGDVRGMGLFFCLELVKDRETKEPLISWQPSGTQARLPGAIDRRLKEKGLSTNVIRNLIFIGPPLCITESELVSGLEMIDEVLGYTDRFIRGDSSALL